SASQTPTEEKEMTKRRKEAYPAGWDEERIRKLAEHYDNQAEDEQVAEHEAPFLAEGQTVMVVPTELVPAIVKLISEKRRRLPMARFSGNARVVAAINNGVAFVRRTHATRGWYDGHDLINWLDTHYNSELNDIIDCHVSTSSDPVHTATIQIG